MATGTDVSNTHQQVLLQLPLYTQKINRTKVLDKTHRLTLFHIVIHAVRAVHVAPLYLTNR